MPLYEYVCDNCQCKFELLRRMSQADEAVGCPSCEHDSAHRVLSLFAAISKGGNGSSEPDGGDFLYQPGTGTKLVVKVERGTHWGVVMVNGSIGWIDKDCLEVSNDAIPAERFEAMLQGGRPDIVEEAAKYIGVPYRYGGSLPANVDCSLLVQTAHAARGINLPRTAASQFEVGRPVNYNELLPGDRLYFVNRSGRINHTALYIGNGQFIHASSRRGCVGRPRRGALFRHLTREEREGQHGNARRNAA